ncbi:hypothetical protein MMC07_009742 [Pseudocyphellaria aurata]|nr:hypothetical protein [Pseudocyphellaria aurata]
MSAFWRATDAILSNDLMNLRQMLTQADVQEITGPAPDPWTLTLLSLAVARRHIEQVTHQHVVVTSAVDLLLAYEADTSIPWHWKACPGKACAGTFKSLHTTATLLSSTATEITGCMLPVDMAALTLDPQLLELLTKHAQHSLPQLATFFCSAISMDSDIAAQAAMLNKIAALAGQREDKQLTTSQLWLPALLSLCSRQHWQLTEHVLRNIVGQPTEPFTLGLVNGLLELGFSRGSKLMDACMTFVGNHYKELGMYLQWSAGLHELDDLGFGPLHRCIERQQSDLCR